MSIILPPQPVPLMDISFSSENVFNSHVPFFNGRLFKTSADWNYTTEPMPGLGGRNMDYPEGHILGGTSCISKLLTSWPRAMLF